MKLLLIAALLGIALANDCPTTYIKKGCLKQNRQVYHQQVANNRDSSSSVYTGKQLDWKNYQNSLNELGCDCAKKVKELGGVGFAMGFYGECWMATDQSELEESLIDINQQSSKCIGHDYQTCNSEHESCMGGADSQFVYGFPSAAPPAIDGAPGNWTEWTVCSKTCGNGYKERERSCNSPIASNGGKDCESEELTETQSCKIVDCPVNGNWSDWSDYENCPVSCGGSSHKRTRSCTNPAPAHGGEECQGSDEESKSCGASPCPVDAQWSNWSGYSTCSKTCATGSQSRSRTCSGARDGGSTSCSGSNRQSQNCNANVRCPYTTSEYTYNVCHGGKVTIKCNDPHQTIQLTNYYWGRTTKSICQGGVDWLWSTSCRGGHGRISGRCNGRNSCNLEANDNWMNDDPCWGTPKYAHVSYKCTG